MQGLSWVPLFGVNAIEKLCYEDDFWTADKEVNPHLANRTDFQYNFKTKFFYERPISELLIKAQNGNQTILRMPDPTKPLSHYLKLAGATNLAYVSGAVDPCKLIANVDGVSFFPNTWRINSFHSAYHFKVRIGGHFHLIWLNPGNKGGADT